MKNLLPSRSVKAALAYAFAFQMLMAAFCAPPVTETVWNRAIWNAWLIAVVAFWVLFFNSKLKGKLNSRPRLLGVAFGFPLLYLLSLLVCFLVLKLNGYAI